MYVHVCMILLEFLIINICVVKNWIYVLSSSIIYIMFDRTHPWKGQYFKQYELLRKYLEIIRTYKHKH